VRDRSPDRAGLIAAVAAVAVLLAACYGRTGGLAGATGSEAASTPAAVTQTPAVVPFRFPSRSAQLAMSRPVSFPSRGQTLAGRLFGSGKTGIVLSHMGPANSDQTAWWPMAAQLARHGYLVLTYDYRGICPGGVAGCSTGAVNSENVSADVSAAVAFIRSRGARRIVVGGASIGAMGSMDVASRKEDVDGLISVSGVEVAGPFNLDQAVLRRISCPKLFVAGEFDREAADSARDWTRWAPAPKEGHVLPTGLHGTDMLSGSGQDAFVPGTLVRLVLSFLRRHAPA
jgi:pimeloyl-ACP methyl ester carboxylesterase